MTEDQHIRLIAQVAAIAIAAAFWPQISRLWRRLGYRDGPAETGWRRGMKVIGMALLIFAGIVLLSGIATSINELTR